MAREKKMKENGKKYDEKSTAEYIFVCVKNTKRIVLKYKYSKNQVKTLYSTEKNIKYT